MFRKFQDRTALVDGERRYTYGEIAEQLFISRKTVQNHVRNILTKLQLRKRYELMRYAIKRGLDMAE